MSEQNEAFSGLGSKVFIFEKGNLHLNGNACDISDDAIPVDVKTESADIVGDGSDDKGWKQTFTFDMKQKNNEYDELIIGAKKQALEIVEDYLIYKMKHRMGNRRRKVLLRKTLARLAFLQDVVNRNKDQGAFMVYIMDAEETILHCRNILYLEMGKVVKVSTFNPATATVEIQRLRKSNGKLKLVKK